MKRGNSFVVAFPSAGKALNCAVAGQQALHETRLAGSGWSTTSANGAAHRGCGVSGRRLPRTDPPSGLPNADDRTWGQMLCSEATASLVSRDLDEAVRLVDLGVWRLRDVPTPERLFQVEYPGMSGPAFPRSLPNRNMPLVCRCVSPVSSAERHQSPAWSGRLQPNTLLVAPTRVW